MMVLQERVRWLNLTNLSDRERDDILDMPIVPAGIFGAALANMQQRVSLKRRKTKRSVSVFAGRRSPTLSRVMELDVPRSPALHTQPQSACPSDSLLRDVPPGEGRGGSTIGTAGR
ncbi:hypothetical protein AMECASPLE_026222 [Ameca splendens]|uniref:Uncharacterized protein n=1 Tax=Ameca splendens TaxID=208324 RepID=A0ABV0XTV6_9TELE